MIKQQSIILASITILLIVMSGITYAATNTTLSTSKHTTKQDNEQEYEIGSKLGEVLVMGCSIFIATVHSVSEPIKEEGQLDDKAAIFYTNIDVKIDEWLWNKPSHQNIECQLKRTLRPAQAGDHGPWEAWNDVNLQVGGKLIVVRWADGMNLRSFQYHPQYNGKPIEFALVVSNTNLFPAIREIITQHSIYIKDPDEIESTPQLLDTKNEGILGGYLVSYFKYLGHLNDKEAIALAKLFGNKQIPYSGWHRISLELMKALLPVDTTLYDPLSDATLNVIKEALVTASGSDDLILAQDAIEVLLRASNNDEQFDIRPFLNPKLQQKIIENYRKLFKPDPIDKEYINFRSRLGIETQ